MSGIFDPTFPVPHGLSAVVSLSPPLLPSSPRPPPLPSASPPLPSLFRRRYVC